MNGRSSMARISRDRLIWRRRAGAITISRWLHAVSGHAFRADAGSRRAGSGLYPSSGDVVTISEPGLGALVNRVHSVHRMPRNGTFGAGADAQSGRAGLLGA